MSANQQVPSPNQYSPILFNSNNRVSHIYMEWSTEKIPENNTFDQISCSGSLREGERRLLLAVKRKAKNRASVHMNHAVNVTTFAKSAKPVALTLIFLLPVLSLNQ